MFGFWILLLLVVQNNAELQREIRIGVVDYPPFVFVREDGEVFGFDCDIIKVLALANNLKPKWYILTYKELFDSLKAGYIDMAAGGLYAEEIDSSLFEHTIPYAKSGLVTVIRPGEKEPESIKDLEGKTIGIIRRKGFEKWLRNTMLSTGIQLQPLYFDSGEELYKALKIGKVDLVIDDYLHAIYQVHFQKDRELRIVGIPQFLKRSDIVFALRANSLFKDKLDKILSWYIGSEPYETKYKYWFLTESPYSQKRRQTRLFFALLLSFVIVILSGVFWIVLGKRREMLNISRGIARSYSFAVELKNPGYRGHSIRVARYTEMIAKKMGVYSNKLEFAALLHDIGMLAVPDILLNRREKLLGEEKQILEMHPVLGYELVKRIPYFEDIALWIRWHHEHWDGSGYPDGLIEEKIPFEARILAVADAFDSMTAGLKGKAMSVEEAKKELLNGSGRYWDPSVVKVALEVLRPISVTKEFRDFYVAIDKLQKKTIRDVYRLHAIYRILEVVQSSDIVVETLQKILEIIRSFIDQEAIYFLLLSDPNGNLRIVAQLGLDIDLVGLVIPKDKGLTRKAFERHEPVLSNDVTKDPLYLPIPNVEVKSELAVPLMIRDKCIGVIDVESRKLNAFDEDDVFFMKAISTAIAAAIEVARYHGEEELRASSIEKKYTEKLHQKIQHLIEESKSNNSVFSVILIKFDKNVELVKSMFPERAILFKHNSSYTIVLPGLDKTIATSIAERLLGIYKNGQFGVAEFPTDGRSVNQLLAIAYKRQMESKGGRG